MYYDLYTFDSNLPFCLILLYIIELHIFLVKVKVFLAQSCLTLCDPRTAACQAPQSRGYWTRQEYWRGLLFPSPRDLSNSGIEPRSPALQVDSLLSEPPGKPTYFPHCIQTVICMSTDFFFHDKTIVSCSPLFKSETH